MIQTSSEAPISFIKVSFLKCIYLFVAALCPPCCVRAFSGYAEQELLLCCRAQALGCGLQQAQLPCGVWDLTPGPGFKPMSPALAGRLLPTRPPGKSPGSHFKRCMHAKSLESCLTLCNPMDYSPPGSSVHGSLQPRIILEWVAVSSSRGSS